MQALGSWAVLVQGRSVTSIPSRYARELLVAASLDPGPTPREELIDRLRPNETDSRSERRRLTKELSRIQATLGIHMWEGDRDVVAVDPGVVLDSDVARLFRGLQSTAVADNDDVEAGRLQTLTALVERGTLLPGHHSEWATALRREVEQLELDLRRRLVTGSGALDEHERLQHARRWAELEPFADDAHRAVIRLTTCCIGRAAAERYRQRVDVDYRAELGVGFEPGPESGVDEASPPAVPELTARRNQLLTRLDDRSLDHRQQSHLLRQLDDLLRTIGHHGDRGDVLNRLHQLGTVEESLVWRQAEVAVMIGDLETARRLLGEHLDPPPPPPDEAQGETETETRAASEAETRAGSEAETMLGIVAGVLRHIEGGNYDARRRLLAIEPTLAPGPTRIDVHLWLSDINDTLGDMPTSRSHAVEALDAARTLCLPHHQAAARAILGFNAGRYLLPSEAALTLDEAYAFANRTGNDGARAAVLSSYAYSHYVGRRLSTSYQYASAAAALFKRIGNVYSFIRMAGNAARAAWSYGDLDMVAFQHKSMLDVPTRFRSTVTESQIRYAEFSLWTAHGDHERALAVLESAHDLVRDLDIGYWETYLISHQFRQLLKLGRLDEALALARFNLDRVQAIDMPPRQIEWVEGDLGCALIAVGDVEAGMKTLRRIFGHGHPTQILFAPFYAWFHHGAMELGEEEAAQSMRRNVRWTLEAVKEDLTDREWELAQARSELFRYLKPMLEADNG